MNQAGRILVVEDDSAIADAVALNLREVGYVVEIARRGDLGLQRLQDESFDLVILDLMLPGMSGQDLCRAVRRRSEVPILMLTARSHEVDKVVGLEIGADDYVTKPFSMLELIARVKTILRRAAPGSNATGREESFTAGGVTLDVERHRVIRDGAEVTLPPKQFDLLRVLIANRGRVIPRERLLELVWGEGEYIDGHTLEVHIHWLRQQVEQDPARPKRIMTVRGIGYRYSDDAP